MPGTAFVVVVALTLVVSLEPALLGEGVGVEERRRRVLQR